MEDEAKGLVNHTPSTHMTLEEIEESELEKETIDAVGPSATLQDTEADSLGKYMCNSLSKCIH